MEGLESQDRDLSNSEAKTNIFFFKRKRLINRSDLKRREDAELVGKEELGSVPVAGGVPGQKDCQYKGNYRMLRPLCAHLRLQVEPHAHG